MKGKAIAVVVVAVVGIIGSIIRKKGRSDCY